MYFPEYSITGQILKNISNVDFARGIIETTPILPNWENQLKKEALIKAVLNSLKNTGISVSHDEIKKNIDGLKTSIPREAVNMISAMKNIETTYYSIEFDENTIKDFHNQTSQNILPQLKQGVYRSKKIEGATDPEEILARVVDFFDWYNSKDAQETHPIILAGIVNAKIKSIVPFEQTNTLVADLTSLLILKKAMYTGKNYVCTTSGISSRQISGTDLTEYLQNYTEYLSFEYTNIKEKVLLLGRDTKVAKVSGRAKLTGRQERIIEYLQDYGILRNGDFSKIFPDISEDSILRDLKILMKQEIVVKVGSTKSSIYELR